MVADLLWIWVLFELDYPLVLTEKIPKREFIINNSWQFFQLADYTYRPHLGIFPYLQFSLLCSIYLFFKRIRETRDDRALNFHFNKQIFQTHSTQWDIFFLLLCNIRKSLDPLHWARHFETWAFVTRVIFNYQSHQDQSKSTVISFLLKGQIIFGHTCVQGACSSLDFPQWHQAFISQITSLTHQVWPIFFGVICDWLEIDGVCILPTNPSCGASVTLSLVLTQMSVSHNQKTLPLLLEFLWMSYTSFGAYAGMSTFTQWWFFMYNYTAVKLLAR